MTSIEISNLSQIILDGITLDKDIRREILDEITEEHYDIACEVLNRTSEAYFRLFLDPCLLDIAVGDWSVPARKAWYSFIGEFYRLHENNASEFEKRRLLRHVREVNAARLGYGKNGLNGKGNTPDGMMKVFEGLPNLLKEVKMSHSIDLTIFIKNFAEDRMTDLISNVVFKEL